MIGFTIVLGKRRKKAAPKRHRRKVKKSRRKIYYFLPVVFIMVFAVIASFFIGDEEKVIEENSLIQDISVFKEINDYSAYYMPVVMNNFCSYKKGDKIENETLVKLGVWSILCTDDMSEYEAFDGELAIPADKVKERINLLFSDEIEFENTSTENEKIKIEFDETTDSYVIPTSGFSPEYSPVLESVSVKKNKTILTVGCLKRESFKQDSSGKTILPEAEKKIILTLTEDKKGYHIEEISEE